MKLEFGSCSPRAFCETRERSSLFHSLEAFYSTYLELVFFQIPPNRTVLIIKRVSFLFSFPPIQFHQELNCSALKIQWCLLAIVGTYIKLENNYDLWILKFKTKSRVNQLTLLFKLNLQSTTTYYRIFITQVLITRCCVSIVRRAVNWILLKGVCLLLILL